MTPIPSNRYLRLIQLSLPLIQSALRALQLLLTFLHSGIGQDTRHDARSPLYFRIALLRLQSCSGCKGTLATNVQSSRARQLLSK